MQRHNARGFTLVEMLLTSAVFTIVTAGVLTMVARTYRSYTNEMITGDVVWQGRAALDLMVRELRLAGYPPRNTYAQAANVTPANSNLVAATFLTAAATSVVFEADLDADGAVERVEYRLNGTLLERSAVPKNADGSFPAAQYAALVTGVNNGSTPLFAYATDPLSVLAAPGNVNSVRINLLLRTATFDPQNAQFRTLRFQGVAHRQNPER